MVMDSFTNFSTSPQWIFEVTSQISDSVQHFEDQLTDETVELIKICERELHDHGHDHSDNIAKLMDYFFNKWDPVQHV